MTFTCSCSWARCVAPGIKPICYCVCHTDNDRVTMRQFQRMREQERCARCRWHAYECGLGQCYCECHGDRPHPHNPTPVVAPGHDEQGHERSFPHLRITHPASPDLDRLIALYEAYAFGAQHPEWTVGGA